MLGMPCWHHSPVVQHPSKMQRPNRSSSGDCDMCKENIETAANKKGIAQADWNKDTKMLPVKYDAKKTSPGEILKRIAYAGYDNEKFLQTTSEVPTAVMEPEAAKNPLEKVYKAYFAAKDVLVKDNGAGASAKANDLAKAIKAVDIFVIIYSSFKTFQHGQPVS